MALVEVIYGYGLRALAGAARVGKVYFRPHGAGVTIGVFQRIPAAFAKHARQIFRSTPRRKEVDGRDTGDESVTFLDSWQTL